MVGILDGGSLLLAGVGLALMARAVLIPSTAMRKTFAPVWTTLVHLLRNAVDHGLEYAPERAGKGKSAIGKILLRTRVDDGRVLIEVVDDGRGIAWSSIAAKAAAANLPTATRQDLIDAVFADGFSTRDDVTDTSGRGIGMSAIREACHEIGGTIELESEQDMGTTVRCSFPEALMSGTAATSVAGRTITASLQPRRAVA